MQSNITKLDRWLHPLLIKQTSPSSICINGTVQKLIFLMGPNRIAHFTLTVHYIVLLRTMTCGFYILLLDIWNMHGCSFVKCLPFHQISDIPKFSRDKIFRHVIRWYGDSATGCFQGYLFSRKDKIHEKLKNF